MEYIQINRVVYPGLIEINKLIYVIRTIGPKRYRVQVTFTNPFRRTALRFWLYVVYTVGQYFPKCYLW